MYRIERAVSDWHRVYTRLCAAQDNLRRGEAPPPGDAMVADQDLTAKVDRLQDEEEQALRALNDALSAAKARAVEHERRRAGDTPA